MNKDTKRRLIRLFIYSVILTFTNVLISQTLKGKVVGIMDGDTFKMLTKDSTLVKVRLASIDCPENKQPYSAKAKDFTSNAIFGKNVTISSAKTDRYKRYISDVVYNDSLSLTHQLLKAGLAWHFIRYSNDSSLQQIENYARINRIGLWKETNPIAPWEWRTNKKNKR